MKNKQLRYKEKRMMKNETLNGFDLIELFQMIKKKISYSINI